MGWKLKERVMCVILTLNSIFWFLDIKHSSSVVIDMRFLHFLYDFLRTHSIMNECWMKNEVETSAFSHKIFIAKLQITFNNSIFSHLNIAGKLTGKIYWCSDTRRKSQINRGNETEKKTIKSCCDWYGNEKWCTK